MPVTWDFPGGSAVKNLPAVQELQQTWVRSLGWEDPLEEGMATHSRIPGESRGQGSRAGYSLRGCQESDTTEAAEHIRLSCH